MSALFIPSEAVIFSSAGKTSPKRCQAGTLRPMNLSPNNVAGATIESPSGVAPAKIYFTYKYKGW